MARPEHTLAVWLHQEDVCQALGLPPTAKYESEGGPSLRAVADLVWRVSTQPRADLEALVRSMVLGVTIGNADAHGRNLSLLYNARGRRLAPLYDVVPTIALNPLPGHRGLSREMAMAVNGVRDLDDVRGTDLIAEGVSWRVPERVVRTAAHDALERLRDSAEPVAGSLAVAGTGTTPPGFVELVRSRAGALLG